MALSALWRGYSTESGSNSGVSTADLPLISIDDLAARYNIEQVSDTANAEHVIVTPKEEAKQLAEPNEVDLRELGTTSPSPWVSFNRREYNNKLQGLKGLEQYDRMRRSDGTVRATLRVFKSPVLAAQWFMEPGGTRKIDQSAADFIWKNLTGGIMSIGWTQILTEALLCCDFGYYMLEKVYENRIIDGKTRTIWRKLAPRHPMDVPEDGWVFSREDGGPLGCWVYSGVTDFEEARRSQLDPQPRSTVSDALYHRYPELANNSPMDNGVSGIPNIWTVAGYGLDSRRPDCVFIPIEKLLVFTFDREAGNIEGTSVLRSAYKSWYFKEQLYKIDAIQKERHGIGIPVIKLPPGYKPEDKKIAEELGRNIRTNERAHIVLPPGWDVFMLKLEGNLVNAMESVEHHNKEIEKNIVGHFLAASQESASGVLVNMFLNSSRHVADIITEAFNLYCIPQLVAYNYPNAKPPKLRHRNIGEAVDWRTMSFAIRNLIGAGVIRPDDKLEENLRDEMGLPPADKETTREVASPQAGPNAGSKPKLPRVGSPRQTPVGQQRNTQGLPKSDAGRDSSGGK